MSRESQFPVGAAVTLAELENGLHPLLHRLRATEPVTWLPATSCWLITERQLCIDVMRDARTYTVDHPGFSTGQVVGPSMLSLDGKEQFRHRQPFERPFRRREVDERFAGLVAAEVDHLIAGFSRNGQAELRRDFAGPVAVKAMVAALGMDETPVTDVLAWYDAIVDAVTRVTAGEPVSKAGREGYARLTGSLLPVLKRDAETSLLAAASGLADGLSDEEIIANAAILLFGGIETTEGMIANACYHLLTNPGHIEPATKSVAYMANVIEESLRLEPAASVIDRYATEDVLLGGASIKKDDLVRISLVGANRDPGTFPNPDQFDPTRRNLRSHVTFAQGPHVCLGIHLARLEAQLALTSLFEQLPGLRLAEGAEMIDQATPRGLVFRKPVAVQAVWNVE